MQHAQHRGLARHQQHTARVPIEAVDEFEFVGLIGPRRAQRLDDPERHAAAAVHGDAGGLVDDQQPIVLVDHGTGDGVHQAGRYADTLRLGPGARSTRPGRTGAATDRGVITPLLARRFGPDRRQTHRVAGCEAGVDGGPLAVHPHLALADDAEQAGARHPGVLSGEESVEAAAGVVFTDHDLLYSGFSGRFRKVLFFRGLCHKLRPSPRLPPERASHVSWSSATRPSNPADSGRVRRRVPRGSPARRRCTDQRRFRSAPSGVAGRQLEQEQKVTLTSSSFAPSVASWAITARPLLAPSRTGALHEKNACERDAAGRAARRTR